jgi:aspartate/methionine/tyrosine aminotransferase
MKINQDILGLKPSATLQINEKVKSLRNAGQTIYHFGFGQSPFLIHNEIVEALQSHAQNNHYLPVDGLEQLRANIAKFLQNHQDVEVDKELIFVGPGSKELLYQSILIFDAHFIIPKGSWVSYIPQIKSKGGTYTILETELSTDFKLTPNVLETFLEGSSATQHVMILNSPNNPTGSVYSEEEYKGLAMVCRKFEVIILSDEIYSQVNFHHPFSPSISKYYPEKTIVFGGLSKVFSAGGYRLGFMALPKEFQELGKVYRSLFSETFSCVASPVQYAGITAYQYSESIQDYVSEAANILSGIAEFVYDSLTQKGVACTRSKGAFYMMIGFDAFADQIHKLGIQTSEELALYLLETYQVALLPGSDFGFEDAEFFFRLAFVDFNGESVLKAYQKSGKIDVEFIQRECPSMYLGTQQLIKFVEDLTPNI